MKMTFSLRCDMQQLAGGQFFLLDHFYGNIPMIFQALQNGIGLTLTEMPNVSQFRHDALMQVISVAWPRDEKTEQGKLWRKRPCMLFIGIYTHSVSIYGVFPFGKAAIGIKKGRLISRPRMNLGI